jgi:glycosyltransferase involved in cell wall biosynthesis
MDKIKVLYAHNYYRQPGGEDTAFSAEVSLFRSHGQEVVEYIKSNQQIGTMRRVNVLVHTLWSWDSFSKMAEVINHERPDVVHFHNTFPLISPSAYYACRNAGIAVIQSLDNPRLLCPSANFYRAGKLCQDCLGKTPPWPSILHGCYHKSSLQTAVVASMLTIHRWIKTWQTKVDFYLVATEFYRQKFIEGGLPAEKIIVKPHFVFPDPGMRPEQPHDGYALFIGRLDPEKGELTMLEAWKNLREIPLKIRGEGQLEGEVKHFIQAYELSNTVKVIGRLSKEELTETIKGAQFLIWPSEGYYETFGYVAVESFSCGVPVITSHIGVQKEMVTDGLTGLHFRPGDPLDLAEKVKWAWEHPDEMAEMGKNARLEYEEKYTADKNYQALMDIYQRTIETHRARTG